MDGPVHLPVDPDLMGGSDPPLPWNWSRGNRAPGASWSGSAGSEWAHGAGGLKPPLSDPGSRSADASDALGRGRSNSEPIGGGDGVRA